MCVDKLFLDHGPIDFEAADPLARHDEIREFIFDIFCDEISAAKSLQVYYVDTYYRAKLNLYDPLKKSKAESKLGSAILMDMISTVGGEANVKIITTKPIDDLRLTLNLGKENRIVYFELNQEKKAKFEIGQYPSQSNTSPKKLHDRCLLWRVDESNINGIHLGNSLDNIDHKDFTISPIQNDRKTFWNRCEHLWKLCGYSGGQR